MRQNLRTAESPDLNPIKNIWDYLEAQLYLPTSVLHQHLNPSDKVRGEKSTFDTESNKRWKSPKMEKANCISVSLWYLAKTLSGLEAPLLVLLNGSFFFFFKIMSCCLNMLIGNYQTGNKLEKTGRLWQIQAHGGFVQPTGQSKTFNL